MNVAGQADELQNATNADMRAARLACARMPIPMMCVWDRHSIGIQAVSRAIGITKLPLLLALTELLPPLRAVR